LRCPQLNNTEYHLVLSIDFEFISSHKHLSASNKRTDSILENKFEKQILRNRDDPIKLMSEVELYLNIYFSKRCSQCDTTSMNY
jgi:hypothetical protein